MNKNIITIVLAMLLPLAVASCYSDDSSLGDPASVKSIEIKDIPPQSAVSFAGKTLTITPEITTDYPESDLKYTWYIYVANSFEEAHFRDVPICYERDLNYEVNLSSGTYVLVLEVKSESTGYARYTRTQLNVATEFSDGFYILKETADGKSEIDLITNSGFSTDILTKMSGEPMNGTPLSLAMVYQQQYVNPDNNQMELTNMLNIFTTADYRAYRTEDMKQIFDYSTICYAGEGNDDVYYNMSNGSNCFFMTSKKGISFKSSSGTNSRSTGKFGLPAVEEDVDKHIQLLNCGRMGMAYWSNTKHGVRYLNSTGTLSTDVTSDSTGAQVCITSGINRIGGVENVWFLSEDKNTKQRYLHLVSNMGALRQTIEINPATHLAKAAVIAACGGSASYIYCVDGGKLYAYGWANNNEIEVALPGLSSNIAYVTNQWFWIAGFGDTTYNFDNLIVGTQSGDSYTLYFFDKLVGGVPTAEAYRTVSGTGKVRYIRRATPVAVSNLIMTSPTAMRAMPIFPTSE